MDCNASVISNGTFVAFDYGKFGLSFGLFKSFVGGPDSMRLHFCMPGGRAVSERMSTEYPTKGLRRASNEEMAMCTKVLLGDFLDLKYPKPGDYVKMVSRDGALFHGICEGLSPRFVYFYASVVEENGTMDSDSILFDSEILRSRVVSEIHPMTDDEKYSFDLTIKDRYDKKWNPSQMRFESVDDLCGKLQEGDVYWVIENIFGNRFKPKRRVFKANKFDRYLFESHRAYLSLEEARMECNHLNEFIKQKSNQNEENNL